MKRVIIIIGIASLTASLLIFLTKSASACIAPWLWKNPNKPEGCLQPEYDSLTKTKLIENFEVSFYSIGTGIDVKNKDEFELFTQRRYPSIKYEKRYWTR